MAWGALYQRFRASGIFLCLYIIDSSRGFTHLESMKIVHKVAEWDSSIRNRTHAKRDRKRDSDHQRTVSEGIPSCHVDHP